MTAKELFELYFEFEANVEFHWNFYLILIIASVGWLLSMKQHPTRQMKMLASLGFVVIAVLNIFTLLRNYHFLYAVQEELKLMVNQPGFTAALLKQQVMALPTSRFYVQMVLAIHLVGASIILIGLWSDRVWDAIRAEK